MSIFSLVVSSVISRLPEMFTIIIEVVGWQVHFVYTCTCTVHTYMYMYMYYTSSFA